MARDIPIILDEEGNVIKPTLSEARIPKFEKKKKLKKPLTEKVQQFVKNLASGMNQTDAAQNAYNLPQDERGRQLARSMGYNLLKKKNIQEQVAHIFEKNNVGLEEALKPIMKGIKAKKVVQYKDEVYVSDIDDLSIQIQASDRYLKLAGAYQKKGDDNVGNNYIQINNIHKDKYSEED